MKVIELWQLQKSSETLLLANNLLSLVPNLLTIVYLTLNTLHDQHVVF